MDSQVLCYVQRKRITDWKRLVLTHDSPAFLYGSNDDRVFASKLRKGSTLWVVSSIPGRNPELVARLEVSVIVERDDPKLKVSPDLLRHFREFKWIAKGTANSRFFGYNDAGPALVRTVFENSKGATWTFAERGSQWRSEYGSRLQRPTLIQVSTESSGSHPSRDSTALEELATSANRSVFISWKWGDNPKELALSLAYALAKNNLMAWLDLLALPRARALYQIQKDEVKLERLLRYGYDQCVCVLAIDSANYGSQSVGSDRNWTLREWNGEVSPGKRLDRVCFNPRSLRQSRLTSATDMSLRSATVDEAASELAHWLQSKPQLA